jgi:ADP-heptose:LPS heptosyltransferase
LGSISEAAEVLLARLLCREPWPRAELRALIEGDSPELFSVVAEGLSDRFDPALAEVYAEVFAEAIAAVRPEWRAAELVARHRRVRRRRRFEGPDPRAVYVLSRHTLGADVAVTSVLLDGLKRRFPAARIVFAGGRKSYELFAADPRLEHLPLVYGHGLRSRIGVWPGVWEDGAIVVDPDSRLTQLGLVPVCPEENYYFFDSRSYGGDGDESLGALARRWLSHTFSIQEAEPYIAPAGAGRRPAHNETAVSFGVGDNPAKRIEGDFEPSLVAALAARGPVVVDSGAGGEEAERARRAAAGTSARLYSGPFAEFASLIAGAPLYVGYDSAGQHVAAACGVPLVSVFAGYPCERFCRRWRPSGRGPIAVLVREPGEKAGHLLGRTLAAVAP